MAGGVSRLPCPLTPDRKREGLSWALATGAAPLLLLPTCLVTVVTATGLWKPWYPSSWQASGSIPPSAVNQQQIPSPPQVGGAGYERHQGREREAQLRLNRRLIIIPTQRAPRLLPRLLRPLPHSAWAPQGLRVAPPHRDKWEQ